MNRQSTGFLALSIRLTLASLLCTAGCKFGPDPVYLNDDVRSGAGSSANSSAQPAAATGGTPAGGGGIGGGGAGSLNTGATAPAAGSAGIVATGGASAVSCRPPKEVLSAQEVVAAVVALGSQWQIASRYLTSSTPMTADLFATTDITLQAADIPGPTSSCFTDSLGQTTCGQYDCAMPLTVDAGTCSVSRFVGASTTSPGSNQNTLLLTAGTAIRLRPYIQDRHPSTPSSEVVVAVVPPCTTPCAADEQRCPNDAVCYAAGEYYCVLCDKRSTEICACVAPKFDDFYMPGKTADYCDYFRSSDELVTGTCQDGVCKPG